MVLTLQETLFVVENVLRKGGKYTKEVQELFQEKFSVERLPLRNCVPALLDKFKKLEVFKTNPILAAQNLRIQKNAYSSVGGLKTLF